MRIWPEPRTPRRRSLLLRSVVLCLTLAVAAALVPSLTAGADPSPDQPPDPSPDPTELATDRAAAWLAGEVSDDTLTTGGIDDPGLAADAALALLASGRRTEVSGQLAKRLLTDAPASIEPSGAGQVLAGATAKLILLATASGVDPRDVAGRDLVATLLERAVDAPGEVDDGRLRDRPPTDTPTLSDRSNAFTQSLGVLALASTGAAPRPTVDHLLAQQCPGGGFRLFLTGGRECTTDAAADVDTTALAVLALMASGATPPTDGTDPEPPVTSEPPDGTGPDAPDESAPDEGVPDGGAPDETVIVDGIADVVADDPVGDPADGPTDDPDAPVTTTADPDPVVAAAVDAALDWLESAQAPDGSWSSSGPGAVANANSTGLAGATMRAADRPDAAGMARSWILARQLGGDAGSVDAGAVAYTVAAQAAAAGGISDVARDQFRRSTAQALLALAPVTIGSSGAVLYDPGDPCSSTTDPPGTDPICTPVSVPSSPGTAETGTPRTASLGGSATGDARSAALTSRGRSGGSVPVVVLGARTQSNAPARLAITGSDPLRPGALGVGLVVAGLALAFAAGRTRRRAEERRAIQ